jgi:hypothetical protein
VYLITRRPAAKMFTVGLINLLPLPFIMYWITHAFVGVVGYNVPWVTNKPSADVDESLSSANL